MSTRRNIPSTILSNYSLVPYTDDLSGIWDDFVEKSINGTFLHTRKFYNHHPENRNNDKSLLFYKKNKLIAVIGCSVEERSGDKVLISHPRSTYGGFVLGKTTGVEDSLAIVQLFLEKASRDHANQIIIKNPFRIFCSKPCDEFDYALWYFGFSILHRELEIAIPLDIHTKIEFQYSEGTRSGLHKAQKTLLVRENNDYETYWKLLEKTLRDRHRTSPTHDYRQFCHLLDSLGPGKIKLFTVQRNSEMIAGVVIFLLNKLCIHAQYIAYDLSFQNERPLNILLHEVSVWAQKGGYRYFNLGRANENNGEVINFNLFKFKESYGGRGVLRETMHIKL